MRGAGLFDITFTGHLGEQDVPNQITTTVVTGPGTFTPSTVTAGVAGINHTAGILSVGSDTALGSARVQLGNARLIAAGGDRTLANNLVLNNNVTTVFGGQRDFGGTFDLTLTGGVTLHSRYNTGQVVNLDVLDTDTVVTMSGVISGGGNFIVPTKRGIGTLIWSGNNTFDVRNFVNASTLTSNDGIRVEGGILRVAHSNALGISAELASVNVRGDLVRFWRSTAPSRTERSTSPAGSSTSPAWTTRAGRGFLNRTSTAAVHTGVLRSLAGCQQHRAPPARSACGTTTTTPTQGPFSSASMRAASTSSARSSAWRTTPRRRSPTTARSRRSGPARCAPAARREHDHRHDSVLEGILELNKTTGPAVAGTLNIGDNVGGDSSAQVRYVSGAGADQIGAVTVNIGTDGLLNLNNYGATDTVGAVTMIAGDTSSARIATGSATTNLDFTGLTVTGRPGITTAVAATVTGGLSFAATRTLTVNDSPGDVELAVSAVIGQSATSGLTKAGAGRLVLSGNNTYDGGTTVSAGALRVQNVGALGVVAGGPPSPAVRLWKPTSQAPTR